MDTESIFDLVVIGGGINGVGIAADAAGRGFKVALCEQSDLASGTSSMSSKLIHGGLRYLEHFAFKMVRKSLKERETLLRLAPHLVHPIRFIMPHQPKLRPPWLIQLGLCLYDTLGGKSSLPKSTKRLLGTDPQKNPLNLAYKLGFEFSDCTVDDARLVIANARLAQDKGALIFTRTPVTQVHSTPSHWTLHCTDPSSPEPLILKSKLIVNATGPWAEQFCDTHSLKHSLGLKLIKGSHILCRQLYSGSQAYLLQHQDARVVFVIPYLNQFTLIGTTDVVFNGDIPSVHISPEEMEYLSELVNQYFHHPLRSEDILHHWSGVRALVHEPGHLAHEVSREYKLEMHTDDQCPPILHIWGGKLTSYRQLAQEAVQLLLPFLNRESKPWTAQHPLPGGDFPNGDPKGYLQSLIAHYPWISEPLLTRYVYQYGTLTEHLLKNAHSPLDLGRCFGEVLYEKEIDYLCENEWAKTPEDILYRRTKLGYLMSPQAQHEFKDWFNENVSF